MKDETFNLSIRKFLKTVGVKSQHEIERAVSSAISERRIAGRESFPASMVLSIVGLGLDVKFDGSIDLE